ncbi:helix-turn-helix domain-containing protein [Flavobacterium rakeshii]|uniref:Helix-turn-helix domain-containing protein n=1 Tax=Flavobacterium rakeshii TaxID=1038845 RepID=A0A6N8HG41_9FLAO|nr:helix-turn-helix domain-containing protein [Flavobacterium rakeshii]MUV04650.1 helix-turn-helix domain-containing protein [Flavobacterium rakeshii]
MTQISSTDGNLLLRLLRAEAELLKKPIQFSEYTVIIVSEGQGTFYADFGRFDFKGPVLLFATPMQLIYIETEIPLSYDVLHFHSDFYCIEYHREEVACNGLLFNNIYIAPSVSLTPSEKSGFIQITDQIAGELALASPSDIVLKSLLQLFLARSSQVKNKEMETTASAVIRDTEMEHFKELLEARFLELRKPSDYAGLLRMTPNNFTKRCTRYFRKTPSQLITERLILEAKKELHLTRKSIKEIAYALNFEDEFYFSRVFKKQTNESPQSFRDKTGISIVADLYR